MRYRFLLLCVLFLQTPFLFATGQSADVVRYEGKTWQLLARPISFDAILRAKVRHRLPKDYGWSTANWDGFTGYWSIENDRLLLDSVVYQLKGRHRRLDNKSFNRIFRRYLRNGRVVASWVTDDLRIADGKLLRYIHYGFERNYENEVVLKVERGKVVGRKPYHNKIYPGYTLRQVLNSDSIGRFLPLAMFPNLKGKRIVTKIQLFPSSCRQFADSCRVSILRLGSDTLSKAEEDSVKSLISNALIAVYPWQESQINGQRYLGVNVNAAVTVPFSGSTSTHSEPIFTQCDEMPRFPGGRLAMDKFIIEHLQWPTHAIDCCAIWRIVVRVVVEPDGSLTCPTLLRRTDAPYEVEVLKLVRQFPRFIPGRQGGKPVRCWFPIVVRFQLW